MTPIVQLLALATGFGLLERLPGLRSQRLPFFRRGFGTDLLHLAVTSAVNSGMVAWVALGSHALAALGVPRLSSLALPGWAAVLLALVLLDLGQTLVHRGLHRFDPLWELHKVHHSSPALDWLATFRAHALEHVLRNTLAPLPIIALGLPLDAVAVAAVIVSVFAVANHSNLSPPLGWLEPLFVTPRLHRIHHTPETSERNFGAGPFTLWDRMLGTFADASLASPGRALGVPGEETTYPQRWLQHTVEPIRRWLGRPPVSRPAARRAAAPSA